MTSLFRPQPPEFVAVILASSVGTRLFPLTASSCPKHLLQVAGTPALHRLLRAVEHVRVVDVIVAISQEDSATISSLHTYHGLDNSVDLETFDQDVVSLAVSKGSCTVVRLSKGCSGTGEALQQIEEKTDFSRSHFMVLPGDLVVLDHEPLKVALHQHRLRNRLLMDVSKHAACTVLLTDVTVLDEKGVPIKESSKGKRGGLSRDEEDIEYMAIAHDNRLIWKQAKVDVEDMEGLGSETTKLKMRMSRLRKTGSTDLMTDWSDVHVYIMAPWVRKLIKARDIISIRDDLLPLMVARQLKGVAATFGGAMKTGDGSPSLLDRASILDDIRKSFPNIRPSSPSDVTDEAVDGSNELEYHVQAVVQPPTVMRAHSVASFLYINRVFVPKSLEQKGYPPYLQMPPQTKPKVKFQSIYLDGAEVGDKATIKSAIIGRRAKIGLKCRLNNVVIGDDCEVGDDASIQNSILGKGCKVGEKCHLNDCQVANNRVVEAGTDAKEEAFDVDQPF